MSWLLFAITKNSSFVQESYIGRNVLKSANSIMLYWRILFITTSNGHCSPFPTTLVFSAWIKQSIVVFLVFDRNSALIGNKVKLSHAHESTPRKHWEKISTPQRDDRESNPDSANHWPTIHPSTVINQCTYSATEWYSLAMPWWVQSFPNCGRICPNTSDLKH